MLAGAPTGHPGGARLDDNVVGVTVADLGAADFGARQRGLVEQGSGAEAGRVLEDAAGGLEAQRLCGLALDPGLAHALDDGVAGVRLQGELGGQ